AASVRPEPGSNSPKKCLTCSFAFLIVCAHLKFNVGALFCSVFKEQCLSKQLIYNNIFHYNKSTTF
ncbi:hypothetical protein ACQKGI_23510, partial [Peribacillus muralis]|uniref:hypothetical protein n=1 Tax=Peribacillus muralis TaxID=264697 RepID=UPI00380F0F3D